jgi:restriction system protein
MTYLEAAAKVLTAAATPLHYREITRRALQQKLIEPKGKTPEATMGAQLYMAVKQGNGTEGGPLFRLAERGHFSLVAPAQRTLDSDIIAHNSKVESELLDFIHEMHPRQVELLIGQLLTAIGFDDVEVTRYSGDGGIDVDATLTVGGVTRVRTAIQVKRWKSNVTGSTVRELRGGLVTDQRGLIITTAGFTKDAIAESQAPGKTPISLIDGKRLVQLLVEKQVGVRRKAVSLLELNVGELLAEQGDDDSTERSAVLWPLPGGQDYFFETLLAFLDQIGAQQPSIEQMAQWVMTKYEKVTKHKVVQSYLRSVLYTMGLIDFDGERVILTSLGQALQQTRSREQLLQILKDNILGITEILEALGFGPKDLPALREYLASRLQILWETDHQVRFRVQWLAAAGAIERVGVLWRLAETGSTPGPLSLTA